MFQAESLLFLDFGVGWACTFQPKQLDTTNENLTGIYFSVAESASFTENTYS